jgi:hypothetical protein
MDCAANSSDAFGADNQPSSQCAVSRTPEMTNADAATDAIT